MANLLVYVGIVYLAIVLLVCKVHFPTVLHVRLVMGHTLAHVELVFLAFAKIVL